MDAWFVIMAGGGGTRLWPASRKRRPKQFLPLLPGGQTLLGATVERLRPLAPLQRVLVVTARSQVEEVRRCLPDLPAENIVAEPEARNTAPCIGLAALEVERRDPAGLLAVIPSDQFVARPEPYRQAISAALKVAARDLVVTIGIRPTGPETGFGYLAPGEPLDGEAGARRVARFVEKPDRPTAERYVADGFLWNSGMFFFSAARLREALGRHLPPLAEVLDRIRRAPGEVGALYPTAPAISIDYGVMERLPTGEVALVPGDFGWNDVGSWSALDVLDPPDPDGNVAVGRAITVDACRNLVYAEPGKLVAAVGVEGLVIVAAGDAVLVLPRERAQDVRAVVQALETRSGGDYL